jgi:hypothetical protein
MLLGVNSGTISTYCMSFQRPQMRGSFQVPLIGQDDERLENEYMHVGKDIQGLNIRIAFCFIPVIS